MYTTGAGVAIVGKRAAGDAGAAVLSGGETETITGPGRKVAGRVTEAGTRAVRLAVSMGHSRVSVCAGVGVAITAGAVGEAIGAAGGGVSGHGTAAGVGLATGASAGAQTVCTAGTIPKESTRAKNTDLATAGSGILRDMNVEYSSNAKRRGSATRVLRSAAYWIEDVSAVHPRVLRSER